MAGLEFFQFPCLSDNYAVLVHEAVSGTTILVDAPDEDAIRAALAEKGWPLTHILVTHHHWDHTQAIEALKPTTGCTVIGPKGEAAKIKILDETIDDGDEVSLGGVRVKAIATPGHTLGQISYWLPDAGVVFTGDTMFSMGCGRVFEGTPSMMWGSLDRLSSMLPDETQVYCGHEYTLANAKFAVTVDPANDALRERLEEVVALRKEGKPTLPTTMGLERATNPFLRARDAGIRAHLGMKNASDAEVFAEIRARKDNF
ncbi:MAG: hydroxyacylglutathione hydrolase [Hyphomicrobiales bacterium]|nr:MAG: hydroxyacylglutathione hydrolase [Hyphomicrobiales bacterium]